MKRFLALLLVVVITATTMSIVVFAASNSESGKYKGKYYRGSISCYSIYAAGTMRWDGTQYPVTASVGVGWYDVNHKWHFKINSNTKQGGGTVSHSIMVYGGTAEYGTFTGLIGQVPIVDDIHANAE